MKSIPIRGVALAAVLLLAAGARADGVATHGCVVEPARTAEIRAPAPGLIARIHARRGDMVKAGQTLVEIDAAVEQAGAEMARQRAQMQGAEKVATARMDFSRQKAQRQQELAAMNFSSVHERDAAVAETRVAEAEFVDAQENRRLAELEHRRLTEMVRQRTIRAPFDAVVVDRLAQPGEVAQTTEGARPLLKLADVSVLHIEALLPAALWSRMRVGQMHEVQFDAAVGGTHSARVTAVDRVLDPASGSFGVRLELPNPQLKLPAGVRCRLRL